MLGGIAFAGLIYNKMDYYQRAGFFTKHMYPVALVSLLGFSLLALMNFSMIAMLGPGQLWAGRRLLSATGLRPLPFVARGSA